MRLAVFSDSHGDVAALRAAVMAAGRCDGYLHLGDGAGELFALRDEIGQLSPDARLYAVSGNCDPHADAPLESVLDIGHCRVLLTHGHRYMVKETTDWLLASALEKGARVALYGHTHCAAEASAQGVLLLCPGRVRHYGGSFAILTVDDWGVPHAEIRFL